MKEKRIVYLALIIIVVVAGVALFLLLRKSATNSVIIKRSVPQGDEIQDTRLQIEACNPLTKEVQAANPNLKCSLIESKLPDTLDDCVDGASIAGCFACKFECK